MCRFFFAKTVRREEGRVLISCLLRKEHSFLEFESRQKSLISKTLPQTIVQNIPLLRCLPFLPKAQGRLLKGEKRKLWTLDSHMIHFKEFGIFAPFIGRFYFSQCCVGGDFNKIDSRNFRNKWKTSAGTKVEFDNFYSVIFARNWILNGPVIESAFASFLQWA